MCTCLCVSGELYQRFLGGTGGESRGLVPQFSSSLCEPCFESIPLNYAVAYLSHALSLDRSPPGTYDSKL
ncbi:hypothetical protein ACVW1C_000964 [Bradyrhizobium sp. USDA 4011]